MRWYWNEEKAEVIGDIECWTAGSLAGRQQVKVFSVACEEKQFGIAKSALG
jgi:hypothetical protein